MVFAKYDEMKESGIEWIDKIPKNWTIKRLRYVVNDIISGPFGSSLKKESYVPKGFKIYGQEQVISGDVNFGDYYISKEKFDQMRRFRVQSNDILVSCVGTFGKILLVPEKIEEGIINPRLIKISINKTEILPEFLYVYLQSPIVFAQLDEFSRGGTMDIINSTILSSILIFVPSISEQKQIIHFLDKKTKEIDHEISKNKKLVLLLKEQKQSTINDIVTKGLDDSVPMKDSGIEWIEKIPKHWDINKIKYTSYVKGRIGYHGLRSDEFMDEGSYLITGTDFKDNGINWNVCYRVSQKRYEQDPFIQIKNNDILITKDGTIGKLAFISNIPGLATLNSHLLVIRPKKNEFIPRYIFWLLKSSQFTIYTGLTQQGTVFNALSQENIENFIYSLPPTNEQKQIADYLDKKIKKIDSLITKVESQIKQLQYFRESLTSSIFTGKICITN